MIIAFEDIGVGSIDAVVATVVAASDADFRKQFGGPARVAVALAGLLAEAAKDRSSDHLVSAWDHPSMVDTWRAMCGTSIEKPGYRSFSTTTCL
jgi:cystathionine beta-lyase family protein involved in aluminum resistance